jgi:intracellular septation protein
VKNLVKLFVDYGPIVVFFIYFFKTGEIQGAIIPLMAASVLAMGLSYIAERKIPPMLLFSSILILIFGFLTIYFDNPIFIKFKVTLVNLIFAAILFIGLYFKKPLIKNLMSSSLNLNEPAWHKLTFRWAIYFLFLAICNEFVYRNFSDAVWVNFKLFGIMGLSILFILSQVMFIQKNMQE